MMTDAARSPGTTAALNAALRAIRHPNLRAVACPTLIVGGSYDRMAPVASLAVLTQELKEAKADYQINVYSGAVHAFTNPEADTHHIQGIGYNAEADKRSWMALNDFFAELFRAP